MNERKLKQLNIIIIITIFIGLVFIGLFVFVFAPKDQNKIEGDTITDFSEDWILKSYDGGTDRIINLPEKLKSETDNVVVLMHKVPENVNGNTAIAFKTEFQNVRVMVGNETVYTNGIMNEQKLMKNAVPCYNIVDIGNAVPGDIITIYLSSGYKKYSGILPEIFYGNKSDIIFNIINNNSVGFVLAISLIATSFILSICLLIMKNSEVNKRKSFYAFSFIFATALWSLLSNPIMQMLFRNIFGIYMSSMVILLIMPVLYIMYQRCFALKRRYAMMFEIGIYTYAINFLTGVIFQICGVCDFATYIVFTKILVIIGLILLSGIMYLAADAYSDKSIYSNFLINVLLLAACLLEGFLSLFSFYKRFDGLVLQTGIYIFLVLMVVNVQKEIVKEVNSKKDEALNSLSEKKEQIVKDINTNLVFRSLNEAIRTLKNDKENSRLIYNTSVYLKNNINTMTESKLVPFKDELEYIKAYLGIEQRINEGLIVELEDKVDNFMIPFASIEPIVENSVRNGALKSTGTPRIVIRIYERLDCFAIQIVDNGKGIGPEKKFVGAISFKEIKKILKTMCRASVEVRNKADKGTVVTVKIPKEGFVIKEE
ncbi:MAG: histidine kinase [Lachnospiraceae bacterium]|nr:histidine kinase [Lachnospiraceae bacterium]